MPWCILFTPNLYSFQFEAPEGTASISRSKSETTCSIQSFIIETTPPPAPVGTRTTPQSETKVRNLEVLVPIVAFSYSFSNLNA